jgi:gliding motility-associated protein GldM
MAGGKETPRQKMIGMMYLVLTALLALNVSSETLLKFIYLNQSLERQVNENSVKNAGIVSRIEKAVDDAGNRDKDVKVLNTAQQVREATQGIIDYTDGVKEEMMKLAGGPDENGHPTDAQNIDVIGNMMIKNKGGAKGKELKEKLNDYPQFLTQLLGEEYALLAFDGKDHPDYKNNKEQRRKDFATLQFENAPVAACLATVSQFQTEIMAYESRALEELARKVGAGDVKFDKIEPMVRAKSNIVAAGTKYEAEMFIAASSSGITPTMSRDGSSIPVENGKGKVEFVASGGTYDSEGLAKKTYTAEITMRMPTGQDSTFRQEIEYFVAKPVIQIQSASVQALYLNCGNELNVQVPALGSMYNPSFSAKGGTAIEGNKKGIVTIVPNSREVTLSVSSGGTFIGSEKFGVRGIPLPTIVPKTGGRPIDLKTGVSAPGPRSITLDAVPDESFAQFLPKDARYRVTEYDVFLGRGSRPVSTLKANSPDINLNQFAAQARPGDRIVIEVKEVQRLNFRGQREPVRMPSTVFTIPLN